MTRMNSREFERYLARDGYHCLHCGTTETLIPQHRANRGSGGRRSLEVPSNVITLCSYLNGLMESDSKTAEWAKSRGWKLLSWQNPLEFPVLDATVSGWFYLDDNYERTLAT